MWATLPPVQCTCSMLHQQSVSSAFLEFWWTAQSGIYPGLLPSHRRIRQKGRREGESGFNPADSGHGQSNECHFSPWNALQLSANLTRLNTYFLCFPVSDMLLCPTEMNKPFSVSLYFSTILVQSYEHMVTDLIVCLCAFRLLIDWMWCPIFLFFFWLRMRFGWLSSSNTNSQHWFIGEFQSHTMKKISVLWRQNSWFKNNYII